MEKKLVLSTQFEIIWWVFSGVLCICVLLPIYFAIQKNYPFYGINIIFIVVFITFTRWLFFLKHTFWARRERIKMVLMVLCIPVLFLLIEQLNFFQTFLDERGVESFLQNFSLQRQSSLSTYIRTEMLFFGVGSVIVTILLPIRLLVSIWRVRNRGTV